MAGVKIIMLRCDLSGITPAERLFENATGWRFLYEDNLSSLVVMTGGASDRKTIAEFPASGIESVEYA